MRRYNEEFLVGGRELGRQGPNKKTGKREKGRGRIIGCFCFEDP